MAFNVLKNKYVFYFIFVVAIANLLGYLAVRDYESLTLFVAIYALSTYFSKKTILNLSVTILGTALLSKPLRREWPWYEIEGMDNKKKEAMENKEGMKELKEDKEEEKLLKLLQNNKNVAKTPEELKEQQIQLMQQMQSMGPLMENAKDLISALENSKIMDMVDKFMPMIEQVALPGTTKAKN